MINNLINSIKDYIYYLKKEGLFVSIHTNFAEYMTELLEFNIHRNPICLMTKSENDAWNKCMYYHADEHFGAGKNFKRRVCRAGVEEYVFRLACGGTVCVSCKEGHVKNSEKEIMTLVNPLCAMIEYLVLISPKTESEISENELVNRIMKYIQRNFYNPIKNEDIARACSCSVSTLCHLFKKYMSVSVRSYIIDLRMAYAKELLEKSNLSVTATAHKSGFSDYNYFAVCFKRRTGSSPLQYRRSLRECVLP